MNNIDYINKTKIPNDKLVIIDGKSYTKNQTAFLVKGQWEVLTDKVYNHETGQYVNYSPLLLKGIVGPDGTIGFFSRNALKNVILFIKGVRHIAIDSDVAIQNNAKFIFARGAFDDTPDEDIPSQSASPVFSFRLPYNLSAYNKRMLRGFDKFPIKSKDRNLSLLLRPFTYGVEFENQGFIPAHVCYKLGVYPLRDGSLPTGVEYATNVIKSSPLALSRFRNIIDVVGNLTEPIFEASTHVHIGGFDLTTENLVKLYHTCYLLDDEIFEMFPRYKRTGEGKSKSYTAPLASFNFNNVKSYASAIINYLSKSEYGVPSFEQWLRGEKVLVHPADVHNDRKWVKNERYHSVNFTNMLFSNSKTIEFRIHESTGNYDKIINWMLIISSIVKYALNQDATELINKKSLDLKTVLLSNSNELSIEQSQTLIDYIAYRKGIFVNYNYSNDPLCLTYIKQDTIPSKFKVL